MSLRNPLRGIIDELEAGMRLSKCLQCGCMKDTLMEIETALKSLEIVEEEAFRSQISVWQQQLRPIQYSCLGCTHCFPAVASNHMLEAYPDVMGGHKLACGFEVREQEWPTVAGEYHEFCDGESCPVAVSTLASVELTEELANINPPALCIVGKTETENIGIDKVIKNTISNTTIRYLVVAGKDPQGHYPGQTLVSLWKNGVDEKMRVVGSQGKRPILRNVSRAEIDRFRQQVQVVDLIGCEDADMVIRKLEQLARQPATPVTNCCSDCHTSIPEPVTSVPVVEAHEPGKIEMDEAGYFVIIPQVAEMTILVEHYSYDNRLQRIIRGDNARTIYWTIIENKWVSQLSHAAYLGKELIKAELSLTTDFKYVQDGA